MIFGDPFDFSIAWEEIDSWNIKDNFWKNGIFRLYIDGVQLPPKLDVAELRVSIGTYAGMNFDAFDKSVLSPDFLSKRLNMVKRYIHQECIEEDQTSFDSLQILNLTCSVMEEQHCWGYLLKISSQEESIIWSNDGVIMNEKILPIHTVKHVIDQVTNAAFQQKLI